MGEPRKGQPQISVLYTTAMNVMIEFSSAKSSKVPSNNQGSNIPSKTSSEDFSRYGGSDKEMSLSQRKMWEIWFVACEIHNLVMLFAVLCFKDY
jgi:hypothetical protein